MTLVQLFFAISEAPIRFCEWLGSILAARKIAEIISHSRRMEYICEHHRVDLEFYKEQAEEWKRLYLELDLKRQAEHKADNDK